MLDLKVENLSTKLNNYDNIYKLVVSINNRPVNTRCFEASCYNPPTRFTIDIKKPIYKYMSFLKTVLTKQELSLYYSNAELFKIIPKEELQQHPKSVEFKLALYLNDDIIIERVDKIENNFNPLSLYSENLNSAIVDIVSYIQTIIHDQDIRFMAENTELIVNYGLNIWEIKALTLEGRRQKLDAIKSKNVVK